MSTLVLITITVAPWLLLFKGPITHIAFSMPSRATASLTTSYGLQRRATTELFSDAGVLQPLTLENSIFFETSLEIVLKLLAFHCVYTPAYPFL